MTSENQPHIFPAAACFLLVSALLLTSLKLLGHTDETLHLDEVLLAATVLFFVSGALSYAGRRMAKETQLAENIAVVIFVIGLLGLGGGLIAYAIGRL